MRSVIYTIRRSGVSRTCDRLIETARGVSVVVIGLTERRQNLGRHDESISNGSKSLVVVRSSLGRHHREYRPTAAATVERRRNAVERRRGEEGEDDAECEVNNIDRNSEAGTKEERTRLILARMMGCDGVVRCRLPFQSMDKTSPVQARILYTMSIESDAWDVRKGD